MKIPMVERHDRVISFLADRARQGDRAAYEEIEQVSGESHMKQSATLLPTSAIIFCCSLLCSPLWARLFIAEIHYNPSAPADAERPYEFVEIYNDEPLPVEISGYVLEGGVDYRFPDGARVEARNVVVVAADPEAIRASSGLSVVYGPFAGRLDNGGEELRLRDTGGSVAARVPYNDRGRWPIAPDGEGPSLVLKDPILDPTEGENWGWSPVPGGTPGHAPFEAARSEVTIHEVYRGAGGSWVELYNPGALALDLAGYRLDLGLDGGAAHVLPAPMSIAAAGYAVVDLAAAGLPLPLGEARVVLLSSDGTRVVDARRLDAQEGGGSTGVLPRGSGRWHRLDAPTPGSENAAPSTPPVVISEIHYHPHSEDEADEFVELVNAGAETLDLGGLAFTAGIRYAFPFPTALEPGRYLVVAKDPARLEQAYGISGVHGPFDGVLADGGELLRLSDPLGRPVDEIHYRDDGSWPAWADGDGPSLELVDLRQDNAVGSAWLASEHEAQSEWASYEYAGRQVSIASDLEFHLWLMGAGEVLIDDLEVVPLDGDANLLHEGGFDGPAAASAWSFDGTHVESRIEPGAGPDGSNALRLVASARGDSLVNHVEQQVPGLRPSAEYAVRFKARWLRGADLLMTRTWGHGLAGATRLKVPRLGGTPGRANSRAIENAGPVISEVSQEPALPAPGEDVLVRARIHDPDGIGGAELRFRLDGADSFQMVPLADDGAAPDERAGDGIFSARIALAAPPGGIAEFYLAARDPRGAERSFPPGAPEETLFYQYDDGIASDPLPAYRLILRARDYSILTKRSPDSNHLLPAALVIEGRRIAHRAMARYKGSPYVRPIADPYERQGFRLRFGGEDAPYAAERLVLDDSLPDASYQADRTVLHLLKAASRRGAAGGIPYGDRGYIHLIVNGRNFGIYEHVIPIDGDYLERSFGDDGGELYKVDNHYEVSDWGGEKLLKRSWNHSASQEDLRFTFKKRTREKEDDFSGLMELLDLLAPGRTPDEVFDERAGGLIDLENWLWALAVFATAGDWDSPRGVTGKNVYLYRPPGGLWKMIPWDHDVALGAWPPDPDPKESASAPIQVDRFPMIARLMQRPAFERELIRTIQRLLAGAYDPAELRPLIDSTHAFLAATPAAIAPTCPVPLIPDRPCYQAPDRMRSFTAARWSYLQGTIFDPPAFTISTNGGQRFATARTPVLLQGQAPMAVETIAREGVRLSPRWLLRTAWEVEVDLLPGLNTVLLTGLDRAEFPVGADAVEVVYEPDGKPFRRGDVNADGEFDLADPVMLLIRLFVSGTEIVCRRSADTDDNGALDITDAIAILQYLFLKGAAPEKPFPACGLDATPDALECAAYPPCEG